MQNQRSFMYLNQMFGGHLIEATLRDDPDKISMAHDIRESRIGSQNSSAAPSHVNCISIHIVKSLFLSLHVKLIWKL